MVTCGCIMIVNLAGIRCLETALYPVQVFCLSQEVLFETIQLDQTSYSWLTSYPWFRLAAVGSLVAAGGPMCRVNKLMFAHSS